MNDAVAAKTAPRAECSLLCRVLILTYFLDVIRVDAGVVLIVS